ncbi:MAG: hypothetical protein U1U88_001914 [Lawsonella clevelandensis]
MSLCLANVIGSFLSTQVVHHQLGGEFMYILPAVLGQSSVPLASSSSSAPSTW